MLNDYYILKTKKEVIPMGQEVEAHCHTERPGDL